MEDSKLFEKSQSLLIEIARQMHLASGELHSALVYMPINDDELWRIHASLKEMETRLHRKVADREKVRPR